MTSGYGRLILAGKLYPWGERECGGMLPSSLQTLTNVMTVKSTHGAFAAITTSRKVYAWGNEGEGGYLPIGNGQLTNVKLLCSNYRYANTQICIEGNMGATYPVLLHFVVFLFSVFLRGRLGSNL